MQFKKELDIVISMSKKALEQGEDPMVTQALYASFFGLLSLPQQPEDFSKYDMKASLGGKTQRDPML